MPCEKHRPPLNLSLHQFLGSGCVLLDTFQSTPVCPGVQCTPEHTGVHCTLSLQEYRIRSIVTLPAATWLSRMEHKIQELLWALNQKTTTRIRQHLDQPSSPPPKKKRRQRHAMYITQLKPWANFWTLIYHLRKPHTQSLSCWQWACCIFINQQCYLGPCQRGILRMLGRGHNVQPEGGMQFGRWKCLEFWGIFSDKRSPDQDLDYMIYLRPPRPGPLSRTRLL